jgi:drug/metabolite transporter (DMT)-like permease
VKVKGDAAAPGRAGPRAVNDSLLLLTAAIWGFAFVAQRAGMERLGPFAFNALRFALGTLALVPPILARRSAGVRGPAGLLRAGLPVGIALFAGASLQQIGLVSTTAGKAGFITGLYVVLVPLLGLLRSQRPGALRWVAVLVALLGLYLLSVTERASIEPGDLLVLAGAFFWALHVQLVGHAAARTDPIELAATQFGICAASSALVSLAAERTSVAAVRGTAVPLLYAGLLSVGVAYTLQVIAQRRAHPTHAAILLSLEGAFAALGGALLLGERLAPRELAGCALMFAAMLLSQIAPRPAR